MKRTISLITIGLVALIANACPPPTAHLVFNAGAIYDYRWNEDWGARDPKGFQLGSLGASGKLGVELPMRYVTISGVGSWVKRGDWKVGGEVGINPLGIARGYDSPINFQINVGCGYMRTAEMQVDNMYASVGLEIMPSIGYVIAPFASCNFNMENLLTDRSYGVDVKVGIRLWLGKEW